MKAYRKLGTQVPAVDGCSHQYGIGAVFPAKLKESVSVSVRGIMLVLIPLHHINLVCSMFFRFPDALLHIFSDYHCAQLLAQSLCQLPALPQKLQSDIFGGSFKTFYKYPYVLILFKTHDTSPFLQYLRLFKTVQE